MIDQIKEFLLKNGSSMRYEITDDNRYVIYKKNYEVDETQDPPVVTEVDESVICDFSLDELQYEKEKLQESINNINSFISIIG